MKQEAPQQRRKPPRESSDFNSEEHVKIGVDSEVLDFRTDGYGGT
jgi:hypothetical protein